jgi:hypothetical protein
VTKVEVGQRWRATTGTLFRVTRIVAPKDEIALGCAELAQVDGQKLGADPLVRDVLRLGGSMALKDDGTPFYDHWRLEEGVEP